MMAAYMILLQLVRFMQSHFRALRVKTLFMFRCKMGPELDQKTLDMDGQKLESAQGQKKRMEAFRNLYTGNEFGIEAFAAGFWDALIQLGGLAVYGAVIGRYSRILFFFLFSDALVTAWLHSLAGRRIIVWIGGFCRNSGSGSIRSQPGSTREKSRLRLLRLQEPCLPSGGM